MLPAGDGRGHPRRSDAASRPTEGDAELVGARLLTSGNGRYEVHDYLMFQRSAQEISAYRASKGKAGVKGNHERWHVARSRRDPGCPLCLSSVAS